VAGSHDGWKRFKKYKTMNQNDKSCGNKIVYNEGKADLCSNGYNAVFILTCRKEKRLRIREWN
jgi:hypothetical protein